MQRPLLLRASLCSAYSCHSSHLPHLFQRHALHSCICRGGQDLSSRSTLSPRIACSSVPMKTQHHHLLPAPSSHSAGQTVQHGTLVIPLCPADECQRRPHPTFCMIDRHVGMPFQDQTDSYLQVYNSRAGVGCTLLSSLLTHTLALYWGVHLRGLTHAHAHPVPDPHPDAHMHAGAGADKYTQASARCSILAPFLPVLLPIVPSSSALQVLDTLPVAHVPHLVMVTVVALACCPCGRRRSRHIHASVCSLPTPCFRFCTCRSPSQPAHLQVNS